VDALLENAVAPGGIFIASKVGRVLELLLGQSNDIAALSSVVFQRIPWQGMVIIAYTKKASERHHSVRDLAAMLVNHHVLDFAERFPCVL
jgi:hypothetical protein